MPTASRPGVRAPSFLRPFAGGLLLALIFLAPLLIGTVHEWARLLVFTLTALLLGATLAERVISGKRIPVTAPLLALGVAVLATAAQLVPLPAGLVRALSPKADEVFSATLGEDYGAHALSLDPAGTLGELAKLSSYAAFFLAAVIYASRSHRRRKILVAVVAAATLVAVLGFAQALAGSPKLLFVYDPVARGVNEVLVRGSFVNGNHFGALMCLAAPCALALGLREPGLRAPAFMATLILNVGAVLSLSRTAMIVAPLAQLITFGLDRWQLRQGMPRRDKPGAGLGLRLSLAAVAVLAIVVTASLASKRVAPAMSSTSTIELEDPFGDPRSKFYAWSGAAEMAMDYRWTGVGRGAFEQAFSQVYDRAGAARFTWVENGYLQSLTDWGVPVALLLLVLACWSLVIALQRLEPDPLAAGALGAILGLAIHEGADFAIELPGIALPALAVLATLFARRSSEPEPGRRLIVAGRAWLAAPVAVVVIALLAARTPRAEAASIELRRDLRDPSKPVAELLVRAERVRAQHPADFYLHAIVGERLARDRHPAAMAWLNDAMFLNPSHPAPHLMAAELLSDGGRRAQALLEYRAAVALHAAPTQIWDRMAHHFSDLQAFLAATPEDPDLLSKLGHWLRTHKRERDAAQVYERALALSPHEVPVLQELTRLALARADTAGAREYQTRLASLDRSPASRLFAAQIALAEGALDDAGRHLDELADRSGRTFDVELSLALAYSAAGNRDRARARLAKLTWATTRQERIRVHETAAFIERRAGNSHKYEWEMEQASRLKKGSSDGR